VILSVAKAKSIFNKTPPLRVELFKIFISGLIAPGFIPEVNFKTKWGFNPLCLPAGRSENDSCSTISANRKKVRSK
jgi:hypothetical protein